MYQADTDTYVHGLYYGVLFKYSLKVCLIKSIGLQNVPEGTVVSLLAAV
jgi:hypothetical protein